MLYLNYIVIYFLHYEYSDNNMLSLATAEGKEIIIMGDVNVEFLKPKSNEPFKNLLQLYGFKQLIKKLTRICDTTSTLIDIIATNNPASIRATNVIPSCHSDHDIIGCVRKLNHMTYKPKEITCRDFFFFSIEFISHDIHTMEQ